MTTKSPVRCAIYTRKSTEEGLDQDFNSLDAQRESGGAYIMSQKAEGWISLADRYDDGGYSGGTLERPALTRLLADIEVGKVDVVVVYKIDRLSRSLMDFARLVEVFDRKSVTFVSMTQSFNTTTSMGRLTLNVLLSFAQFEREVTGERIRDKFAASKKKGIWMGGNPPLGYDVADRKLIVNPAEAETVRSIFQRYLDLGCVRRLCSDLAERGITSKRRLFSNGRVCGGKPMGRSALYLILNNRAYIGQTTHKGASYPGEHEAIVPYELFDHVQRRLGELAPPVKVKTRSVQDGPYAGILFDETGAQMRPTYVLKRPGLRYRYYVSRPALKGEGSKAAICRVPAPAFEAFVGSVLTRLGIANADNPPEPLKQVEILANSVLLRFDREEALTLLRTNASGSPRRDRDLIEQLRSRFEAGWAIVDGGNELVLTLPVRAQFRGGRTGPLDSAPRTAVPDTATIKALARAHRWRQMLLKGEVRSVQALAKESDLYRGHVRLTLNLAFLSPNLTRAILRGEQPPGLRLTHLLNGDIPLLWREQEALFTTGPTGRTNSLSDSAR